MEKKNADGNTGATPAPFLPTSTRFPYFPFISPGEEGGRGEVKDENGYTDGYPECTS
jgi:hypothetical protein